MDQSMQLKSNPMSWAAAHRILTFMPAHRIPRDQGDMPSLPG
jgi:hypothetical protein